LKEKLDEEYGEIAELLKGSAALKQDKKPAVCSPRVTLSLLSLCDLPPRECHLIQLFCLLFAGCTDSCYFSRITMTSLYVSSRSTLRHGQRIGAKLSHPPSLLVFSFLQDKDTRRACTRGARSARTTGEAEVDAHGGHPWRRRGWARWR
jgi:hypothetical protein